MTTLPLFTDCEDLFPELIGYHMEMTVDTDVPMEADLKAFLTDPNTLALPEEYVEYLRTSAFITGLDDFYMEDVDSNLIFAKLVDFVERLGPILIQQHLTHTVKFYAFLLFSELKLANQHVCVPDPPQPMDMTLFTPPQVNRFNRHLNACSTHLKDGLLIESNTLAKNQIRALTTRMNIQATKLLILLPLRRRLRQRVLQPPRVLLLQL
jgi:hypothetical protein